MANVRVRMGNGKNTSMDVDDVAALASFQIWTQLPYAGSPGRAVIRLRAVVYPQSAD